MKTNNASISKDKLQQVISVVTAHIKTVERKDKSLRSVFLELPPVTQSDRNFYFKSQQKTKVKLKRLANLQAELKRLM